MVGWIEKKRGLLFFHPRDGFFFQLNGDGLEDFVHDMGQVNIRLVEIEGEPANKVSRDPQFNVTKIGWHDPNTL